MENKIQIDEGQKEKHNNALNFKENSLEFCRSTSLHGLQYVGEQHRPIAERLFWLLSFSVSLAFVTYFVSQTWNKWQTSPVFVSFAETSTPVWDIPFPAVTICPEIKIKQTALNFTSLCFNLNKTQEEIEDFEKARLVCRSFTDFGIDFNDNFPLGYDETENSSVEGIPEFLQKVSPTLDDMIAICMWRGISVSCERLFRPVITDDGLCFTSNTMNAQQMFREGTVQRNSEIELQFPNTSLWSYESQYSDSDSPDVYPRRAMTNGARGGLLLLLQLRKKEIDALCSMAVYGVKVILTNPADLPVDVHNQYISVPFDRNVIVGIRPRVMTTTDGLKGYRPDRRLCYFSKESYLRYFNLYTQQNCNLECLSNYTLKLCDCVAFYMPRAENMPVCSVWKLDCTRLASDLFAADDNGMEQCNCLPTCTEIKYDIETSQATLKVAETFKSLAKFYLFDTGEFEVPDDMFAAVTFFYKDNQFVTSRRAELYGAIDFLASCGGLLGLYLGFSILSLVEIFYFFTMRLYSNFRAHRKNE